MGSSVTSPPVAHPVSERPAGPALSLASQRYGSMRLWRTLTRVNVHHSAGVPHAPSLCAARCSRIAVTTSAAVVALTAVCATGDGSPTSSRVVGVHVHQCGCTVVVGLIDDATTVDGTGVSGVSVTAEGTIIRRALCKLAITTTQRGNSVLWEPVSSVLDVLSDSLARREHVQGPLDKLPWTEPDGLLLAQYEQACRERFTHFDAEKMDGE